MNFFDYFSQTRIVFAEGALERLGVLVREYGGTRVMIVSDKGIVRAGYDDIAAEAIRKAGAEALVFDGVEENPTTRHVEAAAAFARGHAIDLIVGLGGGSSMDCAKGANFILTNGGRMQDYWGVGKAAKPMLPLIAVPTTAGTGSETQSFALISDETTHIKMACGDKKAAAKVALLDPKLTVSQPPKVAAITGMDAISHAVESYVTKNRTPISEMFSRQAWGLLSKNYPRIFENPTDLEARGGMLLGASLAGLAIENSMLGATHSCANPLTAHFGTTHGIAIGVLLPHVVRRNAEVAAESYAELVEDYGDCSANGNGKPPHAAHAGEALAGLIEMFRRCGSLPERLRDCGIEKNKLDQLAQEAAQQWTAQFNPRAFTEREFREIYECAF